MKVKCPKCACEFEPGGKVISKPVRASRSQAPAAIVLVAFKELTGIGFDPVPGAIAHQAAQFHHKFTLADLELVIAFTKWGRGDGKLGFNHLSCTWRKLMEQGFALFQERLALAREALKRREFPFKPRYSGNDRLPDSPKTAPSKPAKTAPAPADEERLRKQAVEGLGNIKL